jgi:hypothetical protein
MQPVPRPERQHHADNGGDRKGEQENDQQIKHEFAPAVAVSPSAMLCQARQRAPLACRQAAASDALSMACDAIERKNIFGYK